MFEISTPQDYGIQESIALITNKSAKETEAYRRLKLAFAQKLISFQDVTLDDYKSVTLMQEDNRYSFPFLIISDGLTREILSADDAIHWIKEQDIATPKYNGYRLYFSQLPHNPSHQVWHYSKDSVDAVDSISIDFIETNEAPPKKDYYGPGPVVLDEPIFE